MASKSLGSPSISEIYKTQCFWLQPIYARSSSSLAPAASRCSVNITHSHGPCNSTSRQFKHSSDYAHQLYQPRGSSLQSRRASWLARAIMPGPGSTAETYVAYGMTQKLFEACSSQADYRIPQVSEKGAVVPKNEAGEDLGIGDGWWHKELGLAPTFSTWSQVTFLHMHLLTVRLRALPSQESVHTYSRHLIDHFSHNAEERMDILHGLTSRTIRNKFLKDLFIQWRGILAAYDEGLVKGDAVLGAAVWRNLWKASYAGPEGADMDWTKVACVVAYMRRVLSDLSQVTEGDLVLALGGKAGGKPSVFGFSELDKKLFDAKC